MPMGITQGIKTRYYNITSRKQNQVFYPKFREKGDKSMEVNISLPCHRGGVFRVIID